MEDLKEKEDLKSKVEKLKLEVEKAKKDNHDILSSFVKHKCVKVEINEKYEGKGEINRYIAKINNDFINFLIKENYFTKKIIKKLKNIKVEGNDYGWDLSINVWKEYYLKENIELIQWILNIFKEYGDKYEEKCLEYELCKITDCLEKLTPTKTCIQCNSEYPKEAKFCPNCGCQIDKHINTSGSELNLTASVTTKYDYTCLNRISCSNYNKDSVQCHTKSYSTDDCFKVREDWKPEPFIWSHIIPNYNWYDHPTEVKPMEYEYTPTDPHITFHSKKGICPSCKKLETCKNYKVDTPIAICNAYEKDNTQWICSYNDECPQYSEGWYKCNNHEERERNCENYKQFLRKYQNTLYTPSDTPKKEESIKNEGNALTKLDKEVKEEKVQDTKCDMSEECGFYSNNEPMCYRFYKNCDFYIRRKVEKVQEETKKEEKVPLCPTCDWYNKIYNQCNVTNDYMKVMPTKECSNYKKKVLCDSCTYYAECDHPNLTVCDQYENYIDIKKERNGQHACSECDHFNNDICDAFNIPAYGNVSGVCSKFKIREKNTNKEICEYFMNICDKISDVCGTNDYKQCIYYQKYKNSKKESTQCPYFDKCPNITKSMAKNYICNDEESINVQYRKEYCKEYQDFEKEKWNKCVYSVNCKYYNETNPTCIYSEKRSRDTCGAYKILNKNNKTCTSKEKCVAYPSIACENCCYFKEVKKEEKEVNRCPYFDKCTDIKLKNIITSICNNIQYIHNTTECEEYTKFEKEKEKSHKNDTSKSCSNCSNINIKCGSCVNYEKWTPKLVKCLYTNDCSSFNSKDNYCTTNQIRIGCYKPKESLCNSCIYWNFALDKCPKAHIKPIHIVQCSEYSKIKEEKDVFRTYGGLRFA